MTPLKNLGCWILAATFAQIPLAPASWAQLGDQAGFEVSSAILDTSVLFAIGAREAEQALRGSFGWPTFQEGFVEGVYFRFDPDGYARFSPSPRLDEDVFEVICPQASTVCTAKKGALEIVLAPSGSLRLNLTGITPGDTFFVSDRRSELPLPPTILEPLDARLEALLSTGGELIIKREVETVQSVSLLGFTAAATYLRWVSQRQSPRVFPVGWPVPAQSQSQLATGLTQPDQWSAANAGPTAQPQGTAGVAAQQLATSTGASQILELQQQITALQTQLGNVTQPSQPGSAQVAQPFVQDETQAFAQQAQGRNLPDTSRGLGVSPTQGAPLGYQGPATANQWPTGVGAQTGLAIGPNAGFNATSHIQPQAAHVGGVPSRDVVELQSRLLTLERTVLQLQRDLHSEVTSLRRSLQTTLEMAGSDNSAVQTSTRRMSATAGPGLTVMPQPNLQGQGQAETTSAVQQDDATDALLLQLEQKLLQRLAAQNRSVLPENTVAVPNAVNSIGQNSALDRTTGGTAPPDRQLIEEILLELQSADPASPSDTNAEPDLQGNSSSQSNDQGEFVTLTDYLNGVLENEGLEQSGRGSR